MTSLDPGDLAELARAREAWRPADTFDRANMDMVAAWVSTSLGRVDSAEPFAANSVREWGKGERRDGVLAEITLATLHVQAGEPDGPALAMSAIDGVAGPRSARARARLRPLGDTLTARSDSASRDLARHARLVSTSSPA